MFVTHHQKLYYKEYNSTNAPSSIIPNHSAIFWKAVTHKDGTNHYQQWLNFTKDTCFVKNGNATYFGLKITKLLNHCDNVFCSVSCFKQKARGNQIFSLFVSFCVCFFSLFPKKRLFFEKIFCDRPISIHVYTRSPSYHVHFYLVPLLPK